MTATVRCLPLHTPGLTKAQMRQFLQTCRFKDGHDIAWLDAGNDIAWLDAHYMCKSVCSKETKQEHETGQ